MNATDDPVELIPDPETLGRQLAESVRRTDLLRALSRVARRKAAYDRRTSATPDAPAAPAVEAVPRA